MSDKNFEMANKEDGARGIAKAVQRALIGTMLEVIAEAKVEVKAPGLTWSQLEEFLKTFMDKEVTIITQEYEG